MRDYKHKKTTGFTLIEMLVAVFVFSVVMILSTGAIFSIVSANKTSQALKTVLDNLSSALDSMSRDIRYGDVYQCGDENTDFDFQTGVSCPDGDGGTSFAFISRLGGHIIYKFVSPNNLENDAGYIDKCVDSIGNCTRLTAPEVDIRNLRFYVQDAKVNEQGQPKVEITVSGQNKSGSAKSNFNIETMVSQRNLTCKNQTGIICN